MAELITISSDRDLVDATRAGDDAAWAELVARHHPTVVRVARSVKASGATKRTGAALDVVHGSILRGDIDLDAVVANAPQIRDIRCRALAALTGGTVGPALPSPNQRVDDGRRTEEPDRQDLVALANAFLLAPWAWQTALWHGRAEGRAAAEIGPMLGRSANDVNATIRAAEAGLFELYLRADSARISDLDSTSAALLPLIGGHRRGVLSPIDRLRVDELLERRSVGSQDGLHAQRWMAVGADLDALIPEALVPGLVGQPVDRFWMILGVGGTAVGAAGLAAARSERVRRSARIGAVAAIIVAILGAAFLIRNPFDGLNASLISELIAREADESDGDQTDRDRTGSDGSDASGSDDSDVLGGESADGAGSAGGGSSAGGDGTGGVVDTLADRIDLVFPGARQGAVYVPGQELLQLSAVLEARSDFVAGGTGAVSLALTNNASNSAQGRFEIRSTDGIRFVAGGDASAACRPATSDPATCSFTLLPGATITLPLVFSLDDELTGELAIAPSIPGAVLNVPIV